MYINAFKSSEVPQGIIDLPHLAIYNRRAEAHWMAREDIKNGRTQLCYHPMLQKQLMQLRYYTKEKYILIENKEAIKKRLEGKSPDYAEAYIIYNYLRNGKRRCRFF